MQIALTAAISRSIRDNLRLVVSLSAICLWLQIYWSPPDSEFLVVDIIHKDDHEVRSIGGKQGSRGEGKSQRNEKQTEHEVHLSIKSSML